MSCEGAWLLRLLSQKAVPGTGIHTYHKCTGCYRRTPYKNARSQRKLLMDAVYPDLYGGGDGWREDRALIYIVYRTALKYPCNRTELGRDSNRYRGQTCSHIVRQFVLAAECTRAYTHENPHERTRDPVHNNMYNIIHNNVISLWYVENK